MRLIKILKAFIYLLITWFIVRFIISNAQDIQAVGLWLPFRWIIISLLFCSAGWVALINAYRILLNGLGCKNSFGKLGVSYLKGNLARYIPGGVWGYTMRYNESVELNIPRDKVLYSLLFEIGAIIITGLVVSVGTLPIPSPAREIIVTTLLILAIIITTKYANNIVIFIGSKLKRLPTNASGYDLSGRYLILVSLNYLLFWFFWGYAVVAIGHGFNLNLNMWSTTSSFALSYLMGYLAIFIPSGLGVREGVLVSRLISVTTPAIAGTIALWARLVMSISEIFVLFCFQLLRMVKIVV